MTNPRYVEIIVPANVDEDDCLAAAEAEYISRHPDLKGWDLDPQWADNDRDEVVLSVPAWSVAYWAIVPAGTRDEYAAGKDGNRFDNEAEAEAAISSLRECGPDFADVQWTVARFGGEQ